MNRERTKNILIILLTALALALGGLIFFGEGRYTLSGAQEQAIVTLLERNDVVFNERVEILCGFRPMRGLNMTPYEFNFDSILPLFFDFLFGKGFTS